MIRTQQLARRGNGPPIYTYAAPPGVPLVGMLRLDRDFMAGGPAVSHAHDFLVLAYFEHGEGCLRIADQEWQIAPGDVYIIAPGEVVGVAEGAGLAQIAGWATYFPPDVLG